ncbi:MAG: hypothetical protein EXS50_02420 [Candidatus Taylorbacteria bacterium]|nr:hypothetical protein [Candidatus Taylorbacteria bacterium]
MKNTLVALGALVIIWGALMPKMEQKPETTQSKQSTSFVTATEVKHQQTEVHEAVVNTNSVKEKQVIMVQVHPQFASSLNQTN